MKIPNCWLNQLTGILLDSDSDELLLNGTRSMFLIQGNKRIQYKSPFQCSADLTENIQDFVFSQGRRLDPNLPFSGGIIQSLAIRWHAVLSTISPDGCLLSLRRHRFDKIALNDFQLLSEQKTLIEKAVQQKWNILCVGETGSGKTTFLSSIMKEYLFDERLLFLESIPELELISPHWVRITETPPGLGGQRGIEMRQLIEQALRLRPDRIVLAEVRGQEILGLQQAVFSGHPGCLATLHARSIEEALVRLKQLSRMYCKAQFDWESFLAPACFFIMERGCPPRLASIAVLEGNGF